MRETLFSDLNLTQPIRRAIEDMGFKSATEIQAKSIPVMQRGKDIIGRSQTGTGKTLAFGIPVLERIQTGGDLADKAQVLILCPTRELAAQACDEIRKLAKYMQGVRAVEIYGGEPMGPQIQKLKRANIVIGTPGRIMDHIRRKTLKLSEVHAVVLDEADEMLSMGFRADIETILSDIPHGRQTALFSATMPDEILALTHKYQKSPVTVQVNPKAVTVTTVKQEFYQVGRGEKAMALGDLINYYNPLRAIVFCNTKRTVDLLYTELNRCGIDAQALHGDMEQSARTDVMTAFKSGKTQILVATDVAARGIDVNDIEFVFNYDIPQDIEYYVHRIGRTGRAGKSGIAVTLCEGRHEVGQLLGAAKTLKTYIKPMEMPTDAEIAKQRYFSNLERLRSLAGENDPAQVYLDMVQDLAAEGLTAEKLAAVLICEKFSQKPRRTDILKSDKYHTDSSESEKKSVKTVRAKTNRRKSAKPAAKVPAASHAKRYDKKKPRLMEELIAESKPAINYVGGYNNSH